MNVREINEHLVQGRVDRAGVLPRLDRLKDAPFTFRHDFGLDQLPEEEGVILVRGARQYGKSTWLEGQVLSTVLSHGPGSALYLNGDELTDVESLVAALREVLPTFRRDARVRRLFIDEITAVPDWERAIKRVLDAGEMRGVLLVTTGSRATDLRRGAERLPGRKGRLQRTTFLFTPVSYAEVVRVCGRRLGKNALSAYLLSGGCPIAVSELAEHGRLPEYIPEMVRDWMLGECAASGRDRSSLRAVMDVVLARGGTPIGQALVAREAGLANNTVAAGYLELLADLMCLGMSFAWDASRRVALRRKPAKFPPINLLAAVSWDRSRLRTVAEFEAQPPEVQGRWHEWLVAQEVWRRSARRGELAPEHLVHWESKEHEIDFVLSPQRFLEVKRGSAGPMEFAWFPRVFPRGELWVAGSRRFATDQVRGMTLADLLLDGAW